MLSVKRLPLRKPHHQQPWSEIAWICCYSEHAAKSISFPSPLGQRDELSAGFVCKGVGFLVGVVFILLPVSEEATGLICVCPNICWGDWNMWEKAPRAPERVILIDVLCKSAWPLHRCIGSKEPPFLPLSSLYKDREESQAPLSRDPTVCSIPAPLGAAKRRGVRDIPLFCCILHPQCANWPCSEDYAVHYEGL